MAEDNTLHRPLRAVVPVQFGGRPWTLACDMEAIERFEASCQRSIVHFIAETQHPGVMGAPKISERGKLLLALLARHHADELAEVKDNLLGWMNDLAVVQAINAVVALAFPVTGERSGEVAPAPKKPMVRAVNTARRKTAAGR